MLVLPNSIFMHIPKTGGSWCRIALVPLVVHKTDLHLLSIPNVEGEPWLDSRRQQVFCTVRHPVTWLTSYWKHRMRGEKERPGGGWHHTAVSDATRKAYGHIMEIRDDLDRICQSDVLDDFLMNVVRNRPGWLNRFTSIWTDHCTVIMRQEDLEQDLIDTLSRFGEELVELPPPFNVADDKQVPSESVAREVIKAEAEFCEKWGYE